MSENKAFDDTWEEIHSKQEWGQYPSEFVIRFVARNYYRVEDRSKIKILDFGCGGGCHTWYLAREGFDTYAFDGSESAIQRVKKKLEREHLRADLRVRDGINLDYEPETFDAVIDSVCIYANRLEHIKQMYKAALDVLKVDGRLLSSVFGTGCTGFGTGEKLGHNEYRDITEGNLAGRGIVHFFEKEEIVNILEEIGFKEIVVEPVDYIDNDCKISMYWIKARKKE